MTVSRIALAAAAAALLAGPGLAQETGASGGTSNETSNGAAANDGGSALAGEQTLPAPDEVDADTVVATVGDTDITLGHVIALRTGLPPQYQQMPPEGLFNGIIDQLIQQTLLAEQTDELGRVARLTLENEERSLAAAETVQSIAGEAVSDETLQEAYNSAYGDSETGTEYNAAHILVETEEEAQALIEELSGDADFAALARENSIGPSAEGGGELGWFAGDAMVAPFQEALEQLEPGTVGQEPVETQFGWHVIRLNETRQSEAPTLEEVRPELVEQIQREAIEARLEELTSQADIQRIAPDALSPEAMSNTDLLQE